MATDEQMILNVNPGEQDVLHRSSGLTERCNTDQVEGRVNVDPDTAAALLKNGEARECEHCREAT